MIVTIPDLIKKLRSPHADKVYLAEGYTKADLIRDLEEIDFVTEESRRDAYTDEFGEY